MKKIIFFLSFLFLSGMLQAQCFDQYFENKTLRINYSHIGKNDIEKIEIKDFYSGGEWNGTRSFLNEPNRYGNILFEVFDSVSNQLIFSRSYSTLFDEYRTTERAEKEIGSFEECVSMPFPKNCVRFSFTSYSRKKVATHLFEGYFNPKKEKYIPFNKEFGVLNLHVGGKPEDCLDILFIPDGYALSDKKMLNNDMKRFADYILNCSPYSENKNRVNIRAIRGFSQESGITNPNENITKKTLLNSSYNSLDLDRYLMCLNVWKMNEIADDAPYDIIVVICNSTKYGGGGIYNFYCTVNNIHERSAYVIVHELGHTIGGLGDEYYTSEVSVRDFYPEGIEPTDPNLTTLVNFDAKWKNMLAPSTPVPTPDSIEYDNVLGVFEGGGYVADGVYRPFRSCTMKDAVYNKFCPVCTKTLLEVFDYYSK